MKSIVHYMIASALALVLAGQLVHTAHATPAITWEVDNRFRFYRNATAFRSYLDVALQTQTGDLSDWILRTEQKLQLKFYNETPDKLKQWTGWAAGWRDSTCWDRQRFLFLNEDRCEDLTLPVSHRVLASVPDLPASATCKWTYELIGERPSALWITRKALLAALTRTSACRNVAAEVPFSIDGTSGLTLSVTVTSDGVPSETASTGIFVKDLLILGMGDSFGAGVGNPDLPALMDWNIGLIYSSHSSSAKALPVRLGASAEASTLSIASAQAQWLDIRCFRSQYGPQFRAALHLAVELRHTAVTYLDLACDGSRVIEGLLYGKSLDRGYQAHTPIPESQIGLASRLLCADQNSSRTISYRLRFEHNAADCGPRLSNEICEYDIKKYQRENIKATSMRVCGVSGDNAYRRKVDLLFLSIGGNDIGFAPMVADILLGDAGLSNKILRRLAKDVGQLHDAKIGEARLEFLPNKYAALDDAISKFLPIRPGSHKPIFLTAYPMPIDDDKGKTCGATPSNSAAARAALDINPVFARFDGSNSVPSRQLKQVAHATCLLNLERFGWFDGGPNATQIIAGLSGPGEICAGLADEVVNSQAIKLNWQYVGDFLLDWRKHGFCAQNQNEAAHNLLSLPVFHTHLGNPEWTPPYLSMLPYTSRQRWVRTPNDAFVVTNWHVFSPRIQDFTNLLSAATTSAMHPTAEGYARIADSLRERATQYVCSERRGEFSDEPICAEH